MQPLIIAICHAGSGGQLVAVQENQPRHNRVLPTPAQLSNTDYTARLFTSEVVNQSSIVSTHRAKKYASLTERSLTFAGTKI